MATETDWCSQTNWTTASGSLINCLTFETSLSFSDDESSTAKPLILHSPSPDSSPCEITINFAVKHEVRQVYVRSTARVYEIYCAPDSKSSSEYLCTVRCGVATRDGEVLRSPNFREIASLSCRDSSEENGKSEDDWVEVKVGDTSVVEGSKISSETKPYVDSITADQDLFEATAEMDDMNPCISITLRLLSLQSKGCVYVDEIYVFGDPVESENQESHNENSSGSSLMAMFLPTLMQISKTTGLSHLNAVRKENHFVSKDDLKETPHPSDSVIENQLKGKASITVPHEEKLKEMIGEQSEISNCSTKLECDLASVPLQATQVDSNCSAIPSKIPEMEKNHSAVPSQVGMNQVNLSGCNVEIFLEKLMSRMDRIEEICLGFQEKMVMPMNNIEIRLQRVEQQLQTLSNKSQNPALPSGYRITAPDVSCIESDANSCENRVEYTDTRDVESDMKYSHAEELNFTSHDISDSIQETLSNKSQNPALPSGYRITAPDVSCIESDANSCENCVDYRDTRDRDVESDMKYSHAEELNFTPHGISDSIQETLSNKSQNPALPSGYRITAPDVSCIESDANSCENCVDYTDIRDRDVESDMKYSHAEELNFTPHDISDSENTTELLPGLVVAAPEFPEGEGEEDNASEHKVSSSNDKEKQSIDDALSSALAKFLSSQSLESPKSKSISVKAPEFSDEDDGDHASNNGTLKTDPVHFSDSDQFTHIEVLASSHISLENEEKLSKDSNDKNSENTAQDAEHDKFCCTQVDQEEVCVNASILSKQDNVEEDKNEKMSDQNQNSDVSESNTNNISTELVHKQIPDGCSITQDGPSAGIEHTVTTEAPIITFDDNIIKNVLGFSLASTVIDFEIPVLDVKFISQTIPMNMSYLDSLVEKQDTSPRDPSVKQSSDEFSVKEPPKGNDDHSVEEHPRDPSVKQSSDEFSVKEPPKGNDDHSVEEHPNLISVDDGESGYSASNSSFVLDEVLCTSISAPMGIEGDNLAEDHKRNHDQILSTSSLI